MATEGNPTVREIMMRGPVTLGREDTLDLADDIMNLGRIRHLPVLDGERVVGVVSQRDLFRSAFVAALARLSQPEQGL
jgi:acetoin utilization protein AcuB